MTHDDPRDVVSRLDALLDEERRALLEGDLDAMSGLIERKERQIAALLALDPANPDALRGLQAKVDRNQALLDGALEGIRRVAGRMAAFRRVRKSLETYDESGRKKTIPGEVAQRIEKRA